MSLWRGHVKSSIFAVEARYMERLHRNAQDNAQEYIPAVFGNTRRTAFSPSSF